jgi:hypothetical protein
VAEQHNAVAGEAAGHEAAKQRIVAASGEAVRHARLPVQQSHDGITWASFTLYGDPTFRAYSPDRSRRSRKFYPRGFAR